jgi:hypothetical protein
VLSLWLGWFEWACEDQDLSVLDFLVHLWVREVFIEDDTSYKASVFERATGLGNDLNMVEVNILSVEISNSENCLNCNISHEVLALADNLGPKGSDSTLLQEFVIMLLDVHFFLNRFDSLYCDIASLFESISDFQRMNTLVQQFLGLFKESTSKYDYTCGSITNFIILRL